MKYTKIGIFTEKESVGLGYATLFQEWGDKIESHLLSDVEEILPELFDIILIDFSTKRYRNKVDFLISRYLDIAKIALISPYSLIEIHTLLDGSESIDLILTKPFNIERLISFIQNYVQYIDRKMMLETKNTVLAEVVDLNPSRIGVFTMGGILFYANSHYLKANMININEIDRLHFNQISQCQIGFDTIIYELKAQSPFIIQRQEEKRWYESTFYHLENDYIVHICKDITVSKQHEIQLEQSSIFFEQSSEALMIADRHGTILSVNTAFCRITGFSKEEAVGQTPKLLYSGMHDEFFYQNLWNSLIHNGRWQGEIWNKRKNGEIYPEWLSISKATSPKYNEEFYISVFTDISSIKETDRKLYFYANHDPLTGLANRVQFETHLKKSIESAKRRKEKIALMFIDLDKFKEVNDTYGHTIGDMMLKSVTKRLSNSIRGDDFLSRIGGDEFVIVANNVTEYEGILTFASKLAEIMRDPIVIDQKIFFMTLSIGIAIYPEHGENSEDLIKHADAAMYEVKENGRNGCLLYQSSFSEKLHQKVRIESELKVAIEHDQFELYYQPIIELHTNRVIGAEALIRWHHPEHGLLYPASFISFIEESELIYDFGLMVCKKGCKDLQILNTHVHTEQQFSLSINIAVKQFFEEKFVEKLCEVLDDFSINSSQIELEILETQVMKNSDVAQTKFKQLHELGFELALDDFGTGYSSLSYLKNFKLNKLKIDQSFVRDMMEDENDRAIVQTIITMSKIFGMQVQAEGVETDEHRTALKDMGCELVQGYLYSKPIPLESFIDWCKNYEGNHGN
jgi:diguanylate cyclase (GGDEF)-like protein/PAS domain S-box-containing protein